MKVYLFIYSTTRNLLCLLLLTLISTIAIGEEESPVTEIKTDYLSPQDLTNEDHTVMAEYTENYNQCLSESVQQELNNHNDPRVLVDFAMKKCAIEMENLHNWMSLKNLEPGFRQGYIRATSNRAANRILRLVMVQIASKNAAAQTAEEPAVNK